MRRTLEKTIRRSQELTLVQNSSQPLQILLRNDKNLRDLKELQRKFGKEEKAYLESPARYFQLKLSTEPRLLTGVQVQDMIAELYHSKIDSDVKAIKFRQPRRTLEQHVFEMFRTKFGLKVSHFFYIKNIVFESLYGFLYSLHYYAKSDVSSRIFLLVLKNELEEEFRFALRAVSSTLKELLKVKKNKL